jgi:hypothetical protein
LGHHALLGVVLNVLASAPRTGSFFFTYFVDVRLSFYLLYLAYFLRNEA